MMFRKKPAKALPSLDAQAPAATLANIVLNSSPGLLDASAPFIIYTDAVEELLAPNGWQRCIAYDQFAQALRDRNLVGAADICSINNWSAPEACRFTWYGTAELNQTAKAIAYAAYLASIRDKEAPFAFEGGKIRQTEIRTLMNLLICDDVKGLVQYSVKHGLMKTAPDGNSVPLMHNSVSFDAARENYETFDAMRMMLERAGKKQLKGGQYDNAKRAEFLLAGNDSPVPNEGVRVYTKDSGLPCEEEVLVVLAPQAVRRRGDCYNNPSHTGFLSWNINRMERLDYAFNPIGQLEKKGVPACEEELGNLIGKNQFSFDCPELSVDILSSRIESLPKEEQVAVWTTLLTLAKIPITSKGVKLLDQQKIGGI